MAESDHFEHAGVKRSAGSPLSIAVDGLSPPQLLRGEDPAAYDQLLGSVAVAVKPKDFIEEIWMRDIVDLTWEVIRFRRLKSIYLNTIIKRKLIEFLEGKFGYDDSYDPYEKDEEYEKRCESNEIIAEKVQNIINGWLKGERSAVAEVDKLLDSTGRTIESLTTLAVTDELEKLECIDRMIVSAERRRNATLREIDRHRATLGDRLRKAAREADEADIEDITPLSAVE